MTALSDPDTSGLPIVAQGNDRDGEIWYSAEDDGAVGFSTRVMVFGMTNNPLYDSASLTFRCDADDPGGAVRVFASALREIGDSISSASLDDDRVAFAKFGKVYEGEWDDWGFIVFEGGAIIPDAATFMQQAMASEYLQVVLPYGPDDHIVATFDLRGVFDTPVQPNLDYCGQYGRARELVAKAMSSSSRPAHYGRTDASLPVQAEVAFARDSAVLYEAGDMGAQGFRTVLTILGKTDNPIFGVGSLSFFCDVDDPDKAVYAVVCVQFTGEDGPIRKLMDNDDVVLAKFGRIHQGTWENAGFITRDDYALLPDATEFLRTAKTNSFLQIVLSQEESHITATFDLRGAFDTPIQPNLDCCGEYDWEYE